MNIVVDMGNTATKIGRFENDELVDRFVFDANELSESEEFIGEFIEAGDRVLVASVTGSGLEINGDHIFLDHTTKIPVINGYRSPETLGIDRLANACAAWARNKDGNSLVIDAGTCIKYDIVKASGEYIGGNISPGLEMRFRALHEFTAELPLLEITANRTLYGTDTQTSIIEGVQQGAEHEIHGFVERYQSEFPDLTIFMTGGDINSFVLEFKNSIFADPNLTLFGLNEILKYNALS